MKIGIGNDHTAVEMRNEIKAFLEEMGHEVVIYGFEPGVDESTDYPIYGERVGRAVASGEVDGGVLICGPGIGISLAANKVKGVRAAVCSEAYSAKMTKLHNNANIISFGVRVVNFHTVTFSFLTSTHTWYARFIFHYVFLLQCEPLQWQPLPLPRGKLPQPQPYWYG